MRKLPKCIAIFAVISIAYGAFNSCSVEVEYKDKIVEKKTFVCPVCEQEYESAEQLKECQQIHKNEPSQEELQKLLNDSSKESIYEQILAS